MVAGAGWDQAVTGSQEAGGALGAMSIPGAAEDAHWPDPKNRHPQWKATLGCTQEADGLPQPSTTHKVDGLPMPSMTQEADRLPQPCAT